MRKQAGYRNYQSNCFKMFCPFKAIFPKVSMNVFCVDLSLLIMILSTRTACGHSSGPYYLWCAAQTFPWSELVLWLDQHL